VLSGAGKNFVQFLGGGIGMTEDKIDIQPMGTKASEASVGEDKHTASSIGEAVKQLRDRGLSSAEIAEFLLSIAEKLPAKEQ
jgi:hypothetical protein